MFGVQVVSTRGSHAELRRVSASGRIEILTIPVPRALAPDTLRAIYRQACR